MPQLDAADITHRFEHHPPNEYRVKHHARVRKQYIEFALSVLSDLPEGREKSLVATALEESAFWAQAAIARQRG